MDEKKNSNKSGLIDRFKKAVNSAKDKSIDYLASQTEQKLLGSSYNPNSVQAVENFDRKGFLASCASLLTHPKSHELALDIHIKNVSQEQDRIAEVFKREIGQQNNITTATEKTSKSPLTNIDNDMKEIFTKVKPSEVGEASEITSSPVTKSEEKIASQKKNKDEGQDK